MKKITHLIGIICAILAFSITSNAQTNSFQVANEVTVSQEMKAQIQAALSEQISNNSQTSNRNLLATYVGSFKTNDGPFWELNPDVLSGVEAAALIFGGSPSDYAISTNSNIVDPLTITHTAWVSTWGVANCHEVAEDYSLDLGNPGYNDPGGVSTATSAYVTDNCTSGNTNYVWFVGGGGPSNSFITTWEVDAIDLSIEIPTFPGATYNYDVDWGDGNIDVAQAGNASHTYLLPGTYTVEISGLFPQIYFNNSGDKDKIMTIEQWGDNPWSSMNSAFMGATNLISNATDTPDFSNVTDMYGMFAYAESFNGDLHINDWDVSNVTNMQGLFGGAFVFDQDISNWDVSNVETMKLMFAYAKEFNQSIGSWDVGSVKNMESMFRHADNFDQNIGGWNISSVISMKYMFKEVMLSTANYDALLMGWEPQPRQNNVIFDGGDSQYCAGEISRFIMTSLYPTWTITDGGLDPACTISLDAFVTTWTVSGGDLSIEIPTNPAYTYNYNVDWGDGTFSAEFGNASHTYAAAGTYEVRINGDFPSIYFNYGGDKLKIRSIEQWGTTIWGPSMERAFAGCMHLVSNATDTPNFSNVTNMSAMFANAASFNGDMHINNWDVSTVTTMRGMFNDAFSFNADIGSWDVGNVTNMKLMFHYTAFNHNINAWDVSNVRNMDGMFRRNQVFNQDISAWDVGEVVNMSNMFKYAVAFDQNLGSWDVQKVTAMSKMFDGVMLSRANYDGLLMGWNAQTLKKNVVFDGGYSTYCAGAADRQNMIDFDLWIITDGGLDCTPPLAGRFDMEDNQSLSGIMLYPNPMRDHLTVVNAENIKLENVSIYDMTGRLIKTINLTGMTSEISLDVSVLSKATYVVVIDGEDGQISKLMIKE